MSKKQIPDARLADDSLPSDGIEQAGKKAETWNDNVDSQVTDFYIDGSHLQGPFTQDDLNLEKQWELEAYNKARDAACDELIRLCKKGALSTHESIDKLLMTLTTRLIIRHAIAIKADRKNQLQMGTSRVINMVTGNDWMAELQAEAKADGRKFLNVGTAEQSSCDAWINLASAGLHAVTVIIDYAGALLTSRDKVYVPRSDLSRAIGEALNREVQSIGWARLNVNEYEGRARKLPPGTGLNNAFQRLTRGMNHRLQQTAVKRRINLKEVVADPAKAEEVFAEHPDLMAPTNEDFFRKWSDNECKQIGSVYIDLLIDGGFLTQGKTENRTGNSVSTIAISPAGNEAFNEVIERGIVAVFQHMPMLIPPVPHSCRPGGTIAGRNVGSYLLDSYANTHRKTVSHSSLGHHTPKAIRDEIDGGEPEWIVQLNAAQEVPVAVNRAVYDVVKALAKDGCPLGSDGKERLNVHSLTLFSKPRADDLKTLEDAYAMEIAKAGDDLAKVVELRKEVRFKKKLIHEQAQYEQGNASRIETLIYTVDQLIKYGRDQRFWIPWFACSRRRFYGLGALNPTEREVSKALLLMGQKVDFGSDAALKEQVRKDLLWSLATCWGSKTEMGAKSDKLSADERVQWASEPEQLAVIEMIGSDPLSPESFAVWAGEKDRDHLGRTCIAGGGSDPFMFLAACIEWVELFVNETRTWTQLPSGRDCTGSGLQMASVSACDKVDGELCNVAKSSDGNNRPKDIYAAIFQQGVVVNKQLTFSHQINREVTELLLGDDRIETRLERYGLGRSAAKTVGMIATYGGNASTNVQDVLKLMREGQDPFLPQFVGVDDRHHTKLEELSTDEFHKLVTPKRGELPRWRTFKQMNERIEEIKGESQILFGAGKSSMELFRVSSGQAPVKPDRDADAFQVNDGQRLFDTAMAEYRDELIVFNQSGAARERHNDEVRNRIDDVLLYLNACRRVNGLKKIKRNKGDIKISDIDPLIHNFCRAMRSGLETVAPSIVHFRDSIKDAMHEKVDWDRVELHGGSISWQMPHGWKTRQRHLKEADVDTSSKLRIYSKPKPQKWDYLDFVGRMLNQVIDDESIDSVEEFIAQCSADAPMTSKQMWKLNSDEVGGSERRAPVEVDVCKHIDAIVANLCHSMDAALSCEIRKQLGLSGVDCLQVHDCYFTTCGHSPALLKAAQESIKVLFGESVGKDRPLDMFARGIGVPGLADKIRQQPGSERYYDPCEHADHLNNFIC